MTMKRILKIFLTLVLAVSMFLEMVPVNRVYAEGETVEETTTEPAAQETDQGSTEGTDEQDTTDVQTEGTDELPAVEEEQTEEEAEVPAEAPVVEDNAGEEETVELNETAPETDSEEDVVLNAESFELEKELGNGLKVTVAFKAGTVPEGTEVVITPAKEEALEAAKAAHGEDYEAMGADISFVYNGKEIEPNDYSENKVNVTLSFEGEEELGSDFETSHLKESLDEEGNVVYTPEKVEALMTDITKEVEVEYEETWTETVTKYKEVDVYGDIEVEYEEEVPVYETREITEERTEYVTKTREVEKTRYVKVKVAFKWYDPTTWLGYKIVEEKYTVTEEYQEPVTVTVVVGTEQVQVGTEKVKKTRTERGVVGTEKVEDGTEEIVHKETKTRTETIVVGQITEFDSDEFSTFTITWRNGGRTVTVHYVDENGTELEISNPADTHPNMNANSSSPAYLIYDIDGYEYSYTYKNNSSNRMNPYLQRGDDDYHNRDYKYSSRWYDSNWNELANNDDIYVVYKKSKTPSQGGTPVIEQDEEWPTGDGSPKFNKTSKNNKEDGTNIVELSITAGTKPVEKSTPADVIVIFDVSGSMMNDIEGTGQYLVNGHYYRQYGWNGYYDMVEDADTRLTKAKDAVNSMAETLLKNSGVRLSLISFSNTATEVRDFTNNLNTFKTSVNGLTAEGGTNWEAALKLANEMEVNSEAATFVVFVTDGDPTFRISRGDATNAELTGTNAQTTDISDYYALYNVFGAGGSDNASRNFNFAVDQVKEIKEVEKEFYAIGISNSVTKVQNLTTDGGYAADHAFIADDSDAIANAFKSITESIKSALGFGDIEMTDGITELSSTRMEVMHSVDANSFKYYKTDSTGKHEWTTREQDGCAAASYDEETGAVEWNMGSGFQLEDGVTYSVSFVVWPSQEAYDIITDLNNGLKSYDDLTDDEKNQIVKLDTLPPTYTLKTNTDNVNASYKKTSKTGDVVKIEDDTKITIDAEYGDMENMPLTSMRLTIKKTFEDDLTGASDREEEVTLVLLRRNAHAESEEEFVVYPVPQAGGTTSEKIVLNDGNNWSYSLYVSPGFEANGEVLEHGYDFTIREDAEDEYDYHYSLIEEIINPMVVNGEEKFYGDGYLIEDQEVIQGYVDRSLTAVNRVKSGIDIRKILVDDDGAYIDSDEEFTITGKLLDSEGNPYTWTEGEDVDKSGAYHKFVPDPEGTFNFDDFGYGTKYRREVYKGHFASSDEIEFKLKPGEFVRFINVPENSSFEFTESVASEDMPSGYELKEVTAVTQHRVSADDPTWTQDGDVQPVVANNVAKLERNTEVDPPLTGVAGNKQYVVNIVNKAIHGEFFFVYHSSDNTVEKVFTDDNRVQKELDEDTNRNTYTFNIAAEVKEGDGEAPAYLYGGYYKAYADQAKTSSSQTQAEKDAAIAKLTFDEDNWADDAATGEGSTKAAPYTGKKATAWKAADAYTTDKGTKMHPTAGTVYYLKEVPNSYLRPFVQVVYDEYDNNTLKKLYMITALDDGNYKNGGFYDGNQSTPSTKLSSTVKITKNGKTAYTLTAKGIFDGKEYPDSNISVPRGYLISIDSAFNESFEMQPYFVTLDNVKVYGVTNRSVDPGDGTFVLDEEKQVGIKPGITVVDVTKVVEVE